MASQGASQPTPKIRVQFDSLRGFEAPACEQKLNAAAELIEEVLASDEFREKVLSHRWNGRPSFADNQGLSNQQIYDALIAGVETLNAGGVHELGTVNLDLELYKPFFLRKRSVVGYTYPGESTIYINQVIFKESTPADIASNLVHEWTHKLGFEHDFRNTYKRPHSVPYAIGDIFLELAEERENENLTDW